MRVATDADVETVTEIVEAAFADDPTWGPALARPDGDTSHRRAFWRLFAEGGIPHGWVFLADDDAALALWIPPGEDEMSDDQIAQLEQLVTDALPETQQQAVLALWERFEAARPTEPHAYLSLLATRPEHRGQGIAQALVRDNLAAFDEQGLPAYLESTNPGNDHRYERLGFVKTGGFAGITPGSVVSTMWRDVP